ncbi:polysaccharide pyruvyl transferase family protein [Pseudarthrobacter sp. MEB009]|uniref:polysaccharide pyruvyl transferase family protein n=1 Tax=Pseudarthrobacter sp. MEB009 TaxID=3040326 RepID=UPI00255590A3|nr:polysaccharide pyruvyl transferase family protein [Pseudarthrobacter sp. MEB009]
MRVLVLHAYSATNAGDGLLVEETVELLREALPSPDITVAALHPGTFDIPGVRIINAAPSIRGFSQEFRAAIGSISSFSLVVGVGGGYIRAGHPMETVKMLATHGYQLLRASMSRVPSIYLPQSIGPLRFGSLPVLRSLLGKIGKIYLRDDRSVGELGLDNTMRIHDLAIMSGHRQPRDHVDVTPTPVLSVRAVRGTISDPVRRLAAALPAFDGYVQSRGAGNDDTAAMASLEPLSTLPRAQLMSADGPRRVVVAVRLHAALMAINAGHWVVHLAYERKGFGAFDDLGIPEYVFNVNSFDVEHVQALVSDLLINPERRRQYDLRLAESRDQALAARAKLISDIRDTARLQETTP